MHNLTEIRQAPFQKLTLAKLQAMLVRYLNTAPNNNFFLIQTDNQKSVFEYITHTINQLDENAISFRTFDFAEADKLIFDLPEMLSSAFYGNISLQQLELLLSNNGQSEILVLLKNLEFATADIFSRLAVAAELLFKPEFKNTKLKIVALFTERSSSLLNSFIDDLSAINKPEFVEVESISSAESKETILNTQNGVFQYCGSKFENPLKLIKCLQARGFKNSEMQLLASLNLKTLILEGNNHLYLSARLVDLQIKAGLYQQAKSENGFFLEAGLAGGNKYWIATARLKQCEISIKNREFTKAQQELLALRKIFKINANPGLIFKYGLLKTAYCLETYDFVTASQILSKINMKLASLNQPQYLIEVQIKQCYVFFRLKHQAKCRELLELLINKVAESRFQEYAAVVYGLQGIMDLELKKYREAMSGFQKQLFFSRLFNLTIEQGKAVKGLANLYLETGFLKSAEKYYRKHLVYSLSTENDYLISISYFNLAQISIDIGGFEDGIEFLKQHEQLALKLNHPRALADNYALLARVYKIQCRYPEADLLYDLILKISANNNFTAQTTPVEKAELYILTADCSQAELWLSYARRYYQEQNQNRPELLFKMSVLLIKLEIMLKSITTAGAESKFLELFEQDHTELEKALIYYELFMLTKHERYYNSALELYTMLYQEVPYAEFSRKITELKKKYKK